jgi:hypothetical protein
MCVCMWVAPCFLFLFRLHILISSDGDICACAAYIPPSEQIFCEGPSFGLPDAAVYNAGTYPCCTVHGELSCLARTCVSLAGNGAEPSHDIVSSPEFSDRDLEGTVFCMRWYVAEPMCTHSASRLSVHRCTAQWIPSEGVVRANTETLQTLSSATVLPPAPPVATATARVLGPPPGFAPTPADCATPDVPADSRSPAAVTACVHGPPPGFAPAPPQCAAPEVPVYAPTAPSASSRGPPPGFGKRAKEMPPPHVAVAIAAPLAVVDAQGGSPSAFPAMIPGA